MIFIINISNLCKRYGDNVVLNDISLNVDKGKMIGILGYSGCGKSTILKIISNLESKDSGNLINNSINMGFVFQEPRLLNWINVFENVEIVIRDKVKSKSLRKEMVDIVLDKVELLKYKNFMPKELSGGMRQRVSIARALVINPDFLLMDEPFSGLDFRLRLDFIDLINSIFSSENITGIFVTHDSREAFLLCDEIYIFGRDHNFSKKIVLDENKFDRKLDSSSFLKFDGEVHSSYKFRKRWCKKNFLEV